MFGVFWPIQATFKVGGGSLWCKNPILSPNNFTKDLMKTEWLVAGVTTVGSPDRVERAILGMVLGVFWSIQAIFVVREPLCDVGTPS